MGQSTDLKVDCRLANLMPVEGWSHIMGEAIQPERVLHIADTEVCGCVGDWLLHSTDVLSMC